MRLTFNYMLLLLAVIMICSFAGCKKKKIILSFEDENVEFFISGYGNPSPFFIGGMNLHCFLSFPSKPFEEAIVDNLVVFKIGSDKYGFISKDVNANL